MRRLHVLLARRESKLTRYGMREPNLFTRKQYKLFDIMSCKEFLFKYRLKDLFDPSLRPLAWRLFLVYDVLRACEQRQPKLVGYMTNQQRLERYFTSMIENGEIAVDTIISQTNAHSSSSSTVTDAEDDQKIVTHTEKSLVHMAQIKSKLSELRMRTLTLKAMCRIKIKQEVRTFPNDILQLRSLSKILQAYLTFYNPFIKADVADRIWLFRMWNNIYFRYTHVEEKLDCRFVPSVFPTLPVGVAFVSVTAWLVSVGSDRWKCQEQPRRHTYEWQSKGF